MSRTPASPPSLGDILLNHPAAPWRQVRRLVEMAGAGSANVLLLGTAGTGKEAVARAIHALSARREGPFLTFPRGISAPAAIARKLFGDGALAECRHGTFFLEGAAGLTAELQVRLALFPDVRLILAVDGSLGTLLRDERFGGEAFRRLRMFPIPLPELAECPEVLPEVVRELVYFHAMKARKTVDRIPPKTIQMMAAWRWPGSLPELDGFVQRAVRMTKGRTLEAPLDELVLAPVAAAPRGRLDDVEREHIVRTLRECGGIVKEAATHLGLPRTTLNARIKKLRIVRGEY